MFVSNSLRPKLHDYVGWTIIYEPASRISIFNKGQKPNILVISRNSIDSIWIPIQSFVYVVWCIKILRSEKYKLIPNSFKTGFGLKEL